MSCRWLKAMVFGLSRTLTPRVIFSLLSLSWLDNWIVTPGITPNSQPTYAQEGRYCTRLIPCARHRSLGDSPHNIALIEYVANLLWCFPCRNSFRTTQFLASLPCASCSAAQMFPPAKDAPTVPQPRAQLMPGLQFCVLKYLKLGSQFYGFVCKSTNNTHSDHTPRPCIEKHLQHRANN